MFAFVAFVSFFSTKSRHWLGRTSRVGRKTLAWLS